LGRLEARIRQPLPEAPVDLDSLPGSGALRPGKPVPPITRPANALKEELRDLGRAAAPQLDRVRAGLLSVRLGARGEFVVGDYCPPPCSTKLVRGICPVCQRSINFRLGAPRRSGPKKAGKFLDEVFSDLTGAR
jgi:hypothetical protein